MQEVYIFKPGFYADVQKTSQHGKNVCDQVDVVT